ncbi:MAG: hypothetical protein KY476_22555 [Planctomycetes bacterium]|nr:hypothetical protein [Planctomycetota bacterium]
MKFEEDLLVGDFATQKPDRPEPTAEEKARHDKLRAELESVREQYSGLIRKVRGPSRLREKDRSESAELLHDSALRCDVHSALVPVRITA